VHILFIIANKGEGLLPVFPLGPAYVAGQLPLNHELRALDLFLTPDYLPELEEVVSSFKPRLIGVNVRNLDAQNYYAPISLLDDPRAIVSQCQELTDAPVVIGGPAVSIVPGEMLSYLGANAAVVGEGETAFRSVAAALETGIPVASAGSMLTPDKAFTGTAPPCVSEDVTRLNHPDWRLFALPLYVSRGVVASVQTKRGCPFHCIYCTTPQLEGSSIRMRDPEAVADELETLRRDFGIERVYLVDNNFNYPPQHAVAICEAIIRRRLGLRWLCQLHPGYVSEELVNLLKRAGCTLVSVGSESGSEHMLANLGRSYAPELVERTCRWLKEAGIDYWGSLLIGGPGETPQSVETSLTHMEALGPISVHITVGIRIYPNTPLCDIARREGIIDDSTNLLFPTFYLSPAIEPMIVQRMTYALAAHPNWGCNAVQHHAVL
jgi:radical SAM superfamily enzyme YgiQ (UPF0313 family)